jgi:hypothetical protein
MEALKERPPYVRFEKRARETRSSLGGLEVTGKPEYLDEDWVFVTSPGSKDEWEGPASEWFARKRVDVENTRFPAEWYNAFKAAYEMWKRDEEPPVLGTHISLWPGLTPAQFKMLRDIRVLTVEDVAGMNEDTLNRIGMGARALKDRAAAWLQAAQKGIPAEQLVAAQQERDELKAQVTRLVAQVEGLTNQLAAAGLGKKL